jgi:hypothetical protein
LAKAPSIRTAAALNGPITDTDASLTSLEAMVEGVEVVVKINMFEQRGFAVWKALDEVGKGTGR